MENIKIFLKLLNKVGYPNKDIISISQMAGYNLEDFLPDLINEIGEDKTNWFVSEAFSKLSTKDGIRLNLAGGHNEYVYIKIDRSYLDLNDSDDWVFVDCTWGDTHLLMTDEEGNETYHTMDEISDQLDMGDMGDYDDMIDSIIEQFQEFIFSHCGFSIWWNR